MHRISPANPLRVPVLSHLPLNPRFCSLQHGASIHNCAGDGMTLLLASISYTHASMFRLLIEKRSLGEKTIEQNIVTFKAIGKSSAEARNIFQTSLDQAINPIWSICKTSTNDHQIRVKLCSFPTVLGNVSLL